MNIREYNPVQTFPFSLKEKLLSRIWKIINTTFFKFLPYNFRGYRRWWLQLFGAKISKNASIDRRAIIDFPWNLTMHDYSSLGEDSWAYCLDEIIIGEKSCIGKDVYLITGSHNISISTFPLTTSPIIIGSGVWLATGVKVFPGVTVGDFAVVGAFSTVLKNVPNNEIWAGIPAKFIKNRVINE